MIRELSYCFLVFPYVEIGSIESQALFLAENILYIYHRKTLTRRISLDESSIITFYIYHLVVHYLLTSHQQHRNGQEHSMNSIGRRIRFSFIEFHKVTSKMTLPTPSVFTSLRCCTAIPSSATRCKTVKNSSMPPPTPKYTFFAATSARVDGLG
jgi:hypothetical protein